MSDPAVVECAAYGISKLRAQLEEQDSDYEIVVPQNDSSLPLQTTESSTAVNEQ